MPNGDRAIDIGGIVEEDGENDYEGPVLVIFGIDPGVSTGWSALKVPVRLLSSLGASRTLARCRHRHGTVLRSGGPALSGGGGSYSSTDSQHVTDILTVAGAVFEEWCQYEKRTKKGKVKIVNDENTTFVFAIEGFDLRESSMDQSLLAPVRINSIFMDRLKMAESPSRVFFQSASDAKNTVTDERLKRWGLYDSHSGAHARDADRHATLLLRRLATSGEIRTRIFGYDPLREKGPGE